VTQASITTIQLQPRDNVVIALRDIAAGEMLADLTAPVVSPVPRGHKMARLPVCKGQDVLRYGQIIGQAKVT
jgi:altronate hydrolase/galactarate dehydratase